MRSSNRAGEVLWLGKEDIHDGARLLARSFASDPSFAWFFPPGHEREKNINLFCRFMVSRAVFCGQPLAGIRGADGSLQGIALAEDRQIGLWSKLHHFLVELSLYPAYLRTLGQQTLRRLQAYQQASHKAQQRPASMYLVMVGVAPEARGLGYGGVLVRTVQSLDRARSTAMGLGLDTENEANVGLYRHLGFSLESSTELDGLRIFVFHDHKGEAEP